MGIMRLPEMGGARMVWWGRESRERREERQARDGAERARVKTSIKNLVGL